MKCVFGSAQAYIVWFSCCVENAQSNMMGPSYNSNFQLLEIRSFKNCGAIFVCSKGCFPRRFGTFASKMRSNCRVAQLEPLLRRTKQGLILGVSLTHLVEIRDLFFLEAEIVNNIFQWNVPKIHGR